MKEMGYAKRLALVLSIVFLGLVLSGISLFFIINRKEIKSISSLNKVNEYGMYEMTYYCDYKLDDFLEKGARNNTEFSKFVQDTLSGCFPIDSPVNLNYLDKGSISFSVRNEKNELIFARNYNSIYSPSLILHTNPKNDYSSVSTVNLGALGFTQGNIPRGPQEDGFSLSQNCLTLIAPYLPYDGMNETGLAVSLLSIPIGRASFNSDKISLTPTTAVRLILDKAASVEEAIAILSKYNFYFNVNYPCQLFVADSSGTSVIIEFHNGEMVLVYPTSNYQICSNFITSEQLPKDDVFIMHSEVNSEILNRGHILPSNVAMNLLSHLGIRENGIDMLQWSVVYNMTNLTGEIFANRNFEDRTFIAFN